MGYVGLQISFRRRAGAEFYFWRIPLTSAYKREYGHDISFFQFMIFFRMAIVYKNCAKLLFRKFEFMQYMAYSCSRRVFTCLRNEPSGAKRGKQFNRDLHFYHLAL